MAIRSEQINVENNKLIIGSTVNSVNNVGVAMTAHADSELTFSVDNTGTPGIKLLVKSQQIKGAGNFANDADSQILAGSIDTADVADDAITNAKILDDAVDASKISGADGAVTAVSYDYTGVNSFRVPTPVDPRDAATKLYVDDKARGLDFKDSVEVATTSSDDIVSSLYAYSGGVLAQTTPQGISNFIDGKEVGAGSDLVIGDRILVKDRQNASENGIYVVSQFGDGLSVPFEFTRATDFDDDSEVTAGAYVLVTDGTQNKLTAYVLQSVNGVDPVLDTDPLSFVAFSGTATSVQGGNGISVSGTTVSVDFAGAGALTFDGTKLAVRVDGETLEIDGTNDLAVKIGGTNASLAYDATAGAEGLAVKFDDSSIKVGASGLQASILSEGEDTTTQQAVATNTGSTGIEVVGTPASGAEIYVFINGVIQTVGDGVTAGVDVFFMPNGSSNVADVRSFSQVVEGDKLWFNPGVAGFNFTTSDKVRIVFSSEPNV